MTNNDFKKVLDEALKPIKSDLSGVKSDIKGIKETQEEFRTELNEVKDIIEKRVMPPLIEIETTVKSYKDGYVTNGDYIGRLNKRLKTVEDNLGIQPPQELSIPSFE